MSLHFSIIWSLISDSSLEVELLMLEMSRSEDMGIGINMESGGEMLSDTHGSDMVPEKLLARNFGWTQISQLSELLYYIPQVLYDNYPLVDIRITYAKQ